MNIDRRGLDFIKSFESFSSKPYRDQEGNWTIGYGHIKGVTHDSPPISKEEAERLLQKDIRPIDTAIEKHVSIPLSQNEFNAIGSFVFNAGIKILLSSTFIRKLNSGDRQGAAREFLRWVHYKDEKTQQMLVSAGLVRRRKEEMEMFLSDFNVKRSATAA